MGRLRHALTRARYAAIGAALGAAAGGLLGRSAASTGGATGALVGAVFGEFRARAAEEGGVADRLAPGDTDEPDDDSLGDGIEGLVEDRLGDYLPDRK